MNELTGIFLTVLISITQIIPSHIHSFRLEKAEESDTAYFTRMSDDSWTSRTLHEDMGTWSLSKATLSLSGTDGICSSIDLSGFTIETNSISPKVITCVFSNITLRISINDGYATVEEITESELTNHCKIKWE